MIDIKEQNNSIDLISHNTNLNGNLIFSNTAKVDGTIKGNISVNKDGSNALLIIGQDAVVNAEINCDYIIIEGLVKGNIFSNSTVEIRKTGAVFGNIKASDIIIQPGGVLEGTCITTNLKNKT